MASTLVWTFVVMSMVTAPFSASQFPACPNQCDCGQGTRGDFQVTCPKLDDSLIEVSLKGKDEMTISCLVPGQVQVSDFVMLQGLQVGPVNRVQLKMCPIPESLAVMFGNLNVNDFKTLIVFYSNLTNTLNRRQFSGFPSVVRLVITGSNVSNIPVDFFQEFPNLSSLDLKENDITELPLGIFGSVPNLSSVELGGNHLTYLQPGIFQNQTKLKFLNVWRNSLQNLTRGVFESLTMLESLDIHANDLLSLPHDVFYDLKILKNLSIQANNFSTLPSGLFSGTPQIEKIIADLNRQRLSLPSGLLANLTNLKIVMLNNNNISELPADLLRGSSALTTLSLQNNALTNIPDTLFADTTNLEELDISNNQLQNLSKDVFSTLKKLKTLKMANNKLTDIAENTFGSLTQLEELNLEKNQLSHIDPEAFPSSCQLKRIRLSHNHLTFGSDQQKQSPFDIWDPRSPLQKCIKLVEIYLGNNFIQNLFYDWRNLMTQLKTLDLKNNNFSYIESFDLQFLLSNNNTLDLDLSNNKIKIINLQSVEILVMSEKKSSSSPSHQNLKVHLRNNPIQCDCSIYHLLLYIERKLKPEVYEFVNLMTNDLICSTPEEISGESVSNLKSTTITCGLNNRSMAGQECPIPCECLGRPHDNALIIDCADIGLRTAPKSLPYLNETMWNHTELHLERNWLKILPNMTSDGYTYVNKLYVSHNNLTYLDVANIPQNIKVLTMDHNNLTHIDKSILDFLDNQSSLELINIYSNPWQCDCDARDLLNFIQAHFKKVDMLHNMTCSDGRFLGQLSADDLCSISTNIIIAASLTIAIMGIIIGAMAALYYRFQQEIKVWLYAHNLCLWFVTEDELDKDKHYDAFVSYSHKDEDFVVNHLVPGLESGPTPFKLCLHFRDWIAGDWIPNQIARSVEDSRRTMVILSPNFLESVWGRMEFRAAHSQALSEGRARVIVVLYGDVGPIEGLDPELKAYLSMNTYVKWGDPWFWEKLRYALPHPPQFMKRSLAVTAQPELRIKTNFDDKLELMVPTTPNATTPPADKIINPLIDANGLIIPLTNGHIKLLKETNGHENGYVKSI